MTTITRDTRLRDIIAYKSNLLREPDKLSPAQAAEELVSLSSLLSSLNAEIVEKKFILNKKKIELLIEAKSVAKADLLSEATEEWRAWYERVMLQDALKELIRSIKYYLREAETERREFTQ